MVALQSYRWHETQMYNRVRRNAEKVSNNEVGRVLRILIKKVLGFQCIQYLSTRPTLMVSAREKCDPRRGHEWQSRDKTDDKNSAKTVNINETNLDYLKRFLFMLLD